jgi:hypothetical protein
MEKQTQYSVEIRLDEIMKQVWKLTDMIASLMEERYVDEEENASDFNKLKELF